MFNYFFKNVNTLFLTCALAFISIANAQVISVVDEKGTMGTFLKPTKAELYGIPAASARTIPFNTSGIMIPFAVAAIYTGLPAIQNSDHYIIPTSKKYIEVKITGTYKVSYTVTAIKVLDDPSIDDGIAAGTEYSLYRQRGGSFPRVPGSYSYSYHTTFSPFKSGTSTARASRVMPLKAGDKLYVNAKIYPLIPKTVFTINLDNNGCSFLVERIK